MSFCLYWMCNDSNYPRFQGEVLGLVRQVARVLVSDLRTALEPLWEAPSNSMLVKRAFAHGTARLVLIRKTFDLQQLLCFM